MNNIIRQEIKKKINEKIKNDISSILCSFNIEDSVIKKIISDILIWTKLALNQEL